MQALYSWRNFFFKYCIMSIVVLLAVDKNLLYLY